MTLLLDQGLPRSTVKYLAELGIDSMHVGDIGMSTASDESILELAREVVTLDSDFHAILALSGMARAPLTSALTYQGGHCLPSSP